MPYRLNIKGDTDAAKMLLPMARKELETLKTHMEFANLSQHQRTVRLSNGTIIHLERVFGQDTINIEVPEVEVIKEEVKEKLEQDKFFVIVSLDDKTCIIWDAIANKLATQLFSDYPVEYSEFEDRWIDKLEDVGYNLFNIEEAGENNFRNNNVSANTGCGTLVNEYTDEGHVEKCMYNNYWDEPCQICRECSWFVSNPWCGNETYLQVWEEDAEHGIAKAAISILSSYNLTIVSPSGDEPPLNDAGLTSCVRNEIDWEEGGFEWMWELYMVSGIWPGY